MLTRRLLLRAMLVAVLSPLARILPAVPTARQAWDEDLHQQWLSLHSQMSIDIWDNWERACWSTPISPGPALAIVFDKPILPPTLSV